MELILDTANITEIKKYNDILNLAGVTTNPSIWIKEDREDFFEQMKEIRKIIGKEKSLHVQVVAKDYESMLKDAETILENIDDEVYIKVPTSAVGLKAMKELKNRGINVTATGIYTKMQAYLALNVQADYLAPYYNRMENHNIDAQDAIQEIANLINKHGLHSKILAASFKNVSQVTSAFEYGAQAITVAPDILDSALGLPTIQKAVDDFATDWEGLYGQDQNIFSLSDEK
jgi:TalC/MipB family fructose-6-phosphate aldolase